MPGEERSWPLRSDVEKTLRAHGIESLDDIAALRRRDILAVPGIGRKTLRRIERLLADGGKNFLEDRNRLERRRPGLSLSGDETFIFLKLMVPRLAAKRARSRYELAEQLGILPEMVDALEAAVMQKLATWRQERGTRGWPA